MSDFEVKEITPAAPTSVDGDARAARRREARTLLFGDLWEYAPAPESTAVVKVRERYEHFIGGRFVGGGEPIAVHNPATAEQISEIPAAGPDVVDRAVNAARAAIVAIVVIGAASRAHPSRAHASSCVIRSRNWVRSTRRWLTASSKSATASRCTL